MSHPNPFKWRHFEADISQPTAIDGVDAATHPLMADTVLGACYHGSTIPICASISSRALGEKSAVSAVMVSPVTR